MSTIATLPRARRRMSSGRSAIAALGAALVLAACSSGGSDVGGVTTPQVAAQPAGVTAVVGQLAVFHVEASGDGLAYTWQEQRPGGAFAASDGSASTSASGFDSSSDLLIGPLEITRDETRLRAVVANAAGSVTTDEARLDVVWGRVETLEPNGSFDFGPGAGGFGSADGGTAGGGDGEGAGVGGGLGKTTLARIAIERVADGAPLGEALTGATSGLVRLRAGPGAAPLLVTLRGADGARYFDEGKGAMLALADSQAPLHALVASVDRHLGVTTLSEAAYRYAINNFVLDPAAVRAGTVALARSVTPEQLARLTPAQVQLAHEAIRSEVNRLLPTRFHVDAVTTLPTPVDDTSGRGAISDNIYGTMQAVTGGLAFAAGTFNPSLDAPALVMAQQLADDLTDGVIDGVSLDGRSVFGTGGGDAYSSGSLAGLLEQGANTMVQTFGDGATPQPPVIVEQPQPAFITAGGSGTTLRVAASGSSLGYQWLRETGEGLAPIEGAVQPTLRVNAAGDYVVRVSNGGGTVTSDVATVTVGPAAAPLITTQPASTSVVAGDAATFTVQALGTDLRYQWRNTAGPIAGATAPSFTTGTASTYSVDVTNDLGTVRSEAAMLTVTPRIVAPTIRRQPVSQTAAPAAPATLAVGASGHGLAFQWLRDEEPIAGAIASTFTTARAGSYRVTVTNAAGSVTSSVATITRQASGDGPPPPPPPPPPDAAAPVITTQPTASNTIFEGRTVTLTVQATGTSLVYQWQRDGTDIPGATASTLETGTAGSYTVRVSNGAGVVTSSPAVVEVAGAPVITDQPDSGLIAPGQTVTLSVTATGLSLGYQWEREVLVGDSFEFRPVAGASTSSHTTDTAGRYRVQVSNPVGTVTSAIATLTAQPQQQACPAPTGAGTTHTASIAQPQTWTQAASPHLVPTGFTIRAAVTLEPCAVVRLGPDVTLTVNAGGSIVANGAADRPVVIERQDPARPWSRIQALGGGTLRFTHTRLLGGGAPLNNPLDGAAVLDVRGADQTQPPGEQLHVDNVLIEGSASQGVLLREAGGFSPASTGLVIRGSAHAPIHSWASAAGTIPSGTYTGNARDEITLLGTGLAAIVRDATLRDRGVTYRVGDSLAEGRLDVAARSPLPLATLTIEPNVTLRFKRGGALYVQFAQNMSPATGALVALGTAQAPIRFTSAESAPAAGDWLGIHFNGDVDPSTRLDHVRVEYAGGQTSFVGASCRYPPDFPNNAAAIRVFVEPDSAFVTNTTVVASARHGIDRGWLGSSSVSFLGSNDLSGAASCRETLPTPIGAPCPTPPPCP